MRKMILLFTVFVMSISLNSCKDDDDKFEFTPECLASTVWEGEWIYDSHYPPAYAVWVFLSDKKLQWTGRDYSHIYNYTIDRKVIALNEYNTNSWVVTKCTPMELELIQYGDLGTEKLKLKRQFNND